MGTYGVQIAVITLLIVAQGYFVAAEIALVSARRSALQAAAAKGSAGARAAVRLVDDPTRLLSTISVAITLCGFAASAFTAVTFKEPVAAWFRSLGLPWKNAIASALAVFLVTSLLTYVTLVFGELAPKRLGLQRAEKVAASVALPVAWLAAAVAPVVWVLSRSTDLVAPLLGVKPGQGKPGATEEEIKLLVTEHGSLLEEEKRMIHEVFALGDTVAREIMVPRVDAAMLEDTLTVGEALREFRRTGFSRMPLFHDDADMVVGIALLKDLLTPIANGKGDESLKTYTRQPVFIPETKPILDLLQEMRSSHNHMVVVVDEHGGTAGIVTIEDIVEEVIGEIANEFERDYHYINQVSDRVWLVDGRLPVEDANQKLGLHVPDSEEYDTLAGWVLMELGHIPVAGECVRVGGSEVRVQLVRRRRIASLRVTREPAPQGAEPEP